MGYLLDGVNKAKVQNTNTLLNKAWQNKDWKKLPLVYMNNTLFLNRFKWSQSQ